MTDVATLAAAAFRDYVTPSVPSSGVHEPLKSDIRALFAVLRTKLTEDLTLNVADFGSAQEMVEYAYGLDLNSKGLIFQLGTGTYGPIAFDRPFVGQTTSGLAPNVILQGDDTSSTTWSSAVVSGTSADAVSVRNGAAVFVRGLKVTTSGAGSGLVSYNGGNLYYDKIDFGACADSHKNTAENGNTKCIGDLEYKCSGNPGAYHEHVGEEGNAYTVGVTVTDAGMTAAGSGWVGVAGSLQASGMTFSGFGAVTGQRFYVHNGGHIIIGAAGSLTYFPGNAAGSTVLGGLYDQTLGADGLASIGTTALNGNITAFGTVSQVQATNPGSLVFLSASNFGTTVDTTAEVSLTTNTGGNTHQATIALVEDGSNNANVALNSPGNIDIRALKAAATINLYANNAWTLQINGSALLPIGTFDLGGTSNPMQHVYSGDYYSGTTKVVGARDTGWTAMTGTPNESATYDTGSVSLPQLAGRVAALQVALTTHGLIGA